MTGWSNEPRPHWFQEIPDWVYQRLLEIAIYPEEISREELGCYECEAARKDHSDPVPPEVELQQQGAERLEGF